VVAAHRARLERDRADLTTRVRTLQHSFDEMVASSRDSNADDEHDPEGATIAFERAQLVAVLKQATTDLEELDAAVRRVDEGTYGACERCGLSIAPARLEARPAARRCIGCAVLG
jgi:RNA polymerase-binding transcription factor DksA